MKCTVCGGEIPKERLEIVKTEFCVKCAEKRVKYQVVDVLESSSSGRNGWSRRD